MSAHKVQEALRTAMKNERDLYRQWRSDQGGQRSSGSLDESKMFLYEQVPVRVLESLMDYAIQQNWKPPVEFTHFTQVCETILTFEHEVGNQDNRTWEKSESRTWNIPANRVVPGF